MAERTIQGSDCIIKVYNGSAFVPFVCSKDISLEISTNKIETTTLGSGQWLNFDYQSLSWSVTLSAALVLDSVANWSAQDWYNLQTNFLKVDVIIEYKDNLGGYYTAIGQVMVERAAIQSNVGQIALNDLTLQGCKELQIFTGLYVCDAVINSITSNQESPGFYDVIITVNTDETTSYIVYTIDSEPEATNGAGIPSGITINFGIAYHGTPGSHSITVTPYCSNGLPGTPSTQSFSII